MDFNFDETNGMTVQLTLAEDELETIFWALDHYSNYLNKEKPDSYWKHHLEKSNSLNEQIKKIRLQIQKKAT